MNLSLDVRNESAHKRLYTRRGLEELAERVLHGEGVAGAVELSVLFCSDKKIRALNRDYRGQDEATDVLSFGLDTPNGLPVRPLGDVVISLDTVHRRCRGDRARMRAELRLLFCHGVLHLLGHDHGSERARRAMAGKQAEYLGVTPEDAWIAEPPDTKRPVQAATLGVDRVGRR